MERQDGPVQSDNCPFGASSVFGGLPSSTEVAFVMAGNFDTFGVLLSCIKDKNTLHVLGFCAIGRNFRAPGHRCCLDAYIRGPVAAVFELSLDLSKVSEFVVASLAAAVAMSVIHYFPGQSASTSECDSEIILVAAVTSTSVVSILEIGARALDVDKSLA